LALVGQATVGPRKVAMAATLFFPPSPLLVVAAAAPLPHQVRLTTTVVLVVLVALPQLAVLLAQEHQAPFRAMRVELGLCPQRRSMVLAAVVVLVLLGRTVLQQSVETVGLVLRR